MPISSALQRCCYTAVCFALQLSRQGRSRTEKRVFAASARVSALEYLSPLCAGALPTVTIRGPWEGKNDARIIPDFPFFTCGEVAWEVRECEDNEGVMGVCVWR